MSNQYVQLNIRFKAKPGKKEEFRKELSSLLERNVIREVVHQRDCFRRFGSAG